MGKEKGMNSQQYEELCRYFLADKIGIKVEKIVSKNVNQPSRPKVPGYRHKIDLHWEVENELGKYLYIANAKWRTDDKVDQPEVLLLQQVKEELDAHKAMMLTNVGFTGGAIAVAQNKGIALHIVRPDFNINLLPGKNRADIQAKLQQIERESGRPVFKHQIVHKAFDFIETSDQTRVSRGLFAPTNYQEKVISGYETKVRCDYSSKATTAASKDTGPVTKTLGPSEKK